jgi:hypothetical protein
MEYQYTLERSEYLDCCKYEYMVDPTIKKLQHRCWPIGPVALIFFLLIVRPSHWGFYVSAAALAVLWFLLVNYMVARVIVSSAKKKSDQAGENAFRPIRLAMENGAIRVNNSKQKLENYRLFSNLILLFLKGGSTVVLPARVIGGENVEQIRPVLNELEKCLTKQ